MYQFTTTNVINSAYAVDYEGNALLDSTGSAVAKYTGTSDALFVAKVGTFKKDNILSLYKRPYAAGVKEVASITMPTPTLGKVYRITVVIKLSQNANSEYANYTLDYQKPITVEILSSGVASTDAAAFVTQLNGLKNRFGHSYFYASSSSAVITLTAKEDVQRFKSVIIAEETANTSSLTMYDYITVATGAVTTNGKLGFGDDAWMIRSIFVPTAENVRYFGVSREERPVLGGHYTEYVIRYSIEKDGTDGIVSGGKSVTTHVFYVKSDLVSGFESAISSVGLTVNSVFSLSMTDADGTLDVSNGDTDQIVVSGAIGAVTYSSDQITRATVSSTGLVTAIGAGAVVITATDAVGNTDTLAYTIVA